MSPCKYPITAGTALKSVCAWGKYMPSKQLSLLHRIEFPASAQNQEPTSRYPTILALHGRGSNEEDLIGLVPHLPQGLLWISPRAPLVLGPGSYEWYRVRVIGMPDPDQVLAALETIDHFIDEILATYPIDPQKFFLLGFSQGSLLSMCYTLIHPSRVAGVIAQSGYIPNNVDLESNEASIKDKPFILTHGEQDTMIPVEWGHDSRDRLQRAGANLEYHEFPMGHNVSLESLEVIYKWLENQLGT
jgi:phospholipase/carboxylesterase